jgi:hypothetical protein
MAETKGEVRSTHWAVKLVLTVLVGGSLAVPFFILLNLTVMPLLPDMPGSIFWPLYLVSLTTIVATFLYLRERNGWRRSLLMGVAVGLVGSAIIMAVAYLFANVLASMTLSV